jgi:hypothetical protein
MFIIIVNRRTGYYNVVIYSKGLYLKEKVGRKAELYLVDFCRYKIRKSIRDIIEVRYSLRLRFSKTA